VSRWRADITEGMRYVWHTPHVRAIAVGFWVMVLMTAADDLLLAFLGADDLHAGPLAIGILFAAASVGLVVGLPLVPRVVRVLRGLIPAAVFGMVIAASGNLATAFAPTVAVAFACQLVRGVGIPMIDTSVRTFLQRETPPALLGRALANVYGGVGVAAALGYLYGGPFLDATSPRVAFAAIGLGGLFGAALTAWLVQRGKHDGRPTAQPAHQQ
jgi:MFS family permease